MQSKEKKKIVIPLSRVELKRYIIKGFAMNVNPLPRLRKQFGVTISVSNKPILDYDLVWLKKDQEFYESKHVILAPQEPESILMKQDKAYTLTFHVSRRQFELLYRKSGKCLAVKQEAIDDFLQAYEPHEKVMYKRSFNCFYMRFYSLVETLIVLECLDEKLNLYRVWELGRGTVLTTNFYTADILDQLIRNTQFRYQALTVTNDDLEPFIF